MKKLVVASVIAALCGSPLVPSKAHAGSDEAWAAIGGFIGGVVVGTAIHDHDDHGHHGHGRHWCPPPRCGGTEIIIRGGGGYRRCAPGHWEWVRVKVWVPGHWRWERDGCGRRIKVWVPGCHEYRRERRWVENRCGHRRCH